MADTELRELIGLTRDYLEEMRFSGEDFLYFRKKREKSKEESLSILSKDVKLCKKCGLWRTRKNVVFGDGNPEGGIMLIGEAPGRGEDIRGLPFVGEAGKVLNDLLNEAGLSRSDVYITNVVKCRPPENRDPMPDEIDSCKPWLEKQIDIIKPRIICTMGRHSTSTILGFKVSITAVRGKIHFIDGMKILPTLHPAALLYHREWRKNVVEDFKLLAKLRKDRKS